MKSQNKNNKLAFNTTAVMELNDAQMHDIDGGLTPVAVAAAASSAGCAAVGGAIVGGVIAWIWA